MAQAVLAGPSQGSQAGILLGKSLHVVVFPCVGKTDTSYEHEVERTVVVLAEQAAQINQQVSIGSDKIPLIILVKLFETTFSLQSRNVQTSTDYRGEETAE